MSHISTEEMVEELIGMESAIKQDYARGEDPLPALRAAFSEFTFEWKYPTGLDLPENSNRIMIIHIHAGRFIEVCKKSSDIDVLVKTIDDIVNRETNLSQLIADYVFDENGNIDAFKLAKLQNRCNGITIKYSSSEQVLVVSINQVWLVNRFDKTFKG